MKNPKKMTAKEFREEGYLQELNRQFLHPLGLALEVLIDDSGIERFGGVWDSRDDPEGFVFGDFDLEKAERVEAQFFEKALVRQKKFGFVVQTYPLTEKEE